MSFNSIKSVTDYIVEYYIWLNQPSKLLLMKDNESNYYMMVYDNHPDLDRCKEVVEYMRANGRNFMVRRRYRTHIDYRATLDDETITYMMLLFGDIIRTEYKV